MKKFGMVAIMLAAVCCGALLVGCADGGGDEENDYETKKELSYWNKSYKANDYDWEEITDANRSKIVGTYKAVVEFDEDFLKETGFFGGYEMQKENGALGWRSSMEFIIDSSFQKCTYTLVDDSSKCESKEMYEMAKESFEEGFSNDKFKYSFENNIATATAESLSIEQLREVLDCTGFAFNNANGMILLKSKAYRQVDFVFNGGGDNYGDRADYVVVKMM